MFPDGDGMCYCTGIILLREDLSMMYIQPQGALVLSLFLLVLSACATEGTTASSDSTKSMTSSSPVKVVTQASAPSYDSQQACLTRIPSGGTAGTRMLAEQGCRREGPISSSLLGATDTKNRNQMASGSVEDSLDGCMARIPQTSSAGQHMLAAESCKRDQANHR